MTNFITPSELFAPHFTDAPDVQFSKATMVISATTHTGATVVSTTTFAGEAAGARLQQTWNDPGFSSVVGSALDQVISDLGNSIARAQELAAPICTQA